MIKIWTSSYITIDRMVLPEERSKIKWYRALYFYMARGSKETAKGNIGQLIRTFVHEIILENSAPFLKHPPPSISGPLLVQIFITNKVEVALVVQEHNTVDWKSWNNIPDGDWFEFILIGQTGEISDTASADHSDQKKNKMTKIPEDILLHEPMWQNMRNFIVLL